MRAQDIGYKAVNAVRAVICGDIYRSGSPEIVLQNDGIAAAEAENGGRLCTGSACGLHGLQHRRNTDSAADEDRAVAQRG